MDFLTTIDWMVILKIIAIDIMLGVDNAIVIALACAALPVAIRPKAILFGTAGAILLRIILLVFASQLIELSYIKLIAGAYLIFIGYSLLVSNEETHAIDASTSMRAAIQTILVADFMMSLDNVLAVVAAAQGTGSHSTFYAIAGILITIPVIIYGAQYIIKIMDRYPIIIWIGAGLLGWVGAEMMVTDLVLKPHLTGYWPLYLKIAGFGAVILAASLRKNLLKSSEAKN